MYQNGRREAPPFLRGRPLLVSTPESEMFHAQNYLRWAMFMALATRNPNAAVLNQRIHGLVASTHRLQASASVVGRPAPRAHVSGWDQGDITLAIDTLGISARKFIGMNGCATNVGNAGLAENIKLTHDAQGNISCRLPMSAGQASKSTRTSWLAKAHLTNVRPDINSAGVSSKAQVPL